MKIKFRGEIAAVVGRFQVPNLHEGHRSFLTELLNQYQQVVVLFGVAPVLGSKVNPMDYATREFMIKDFDERIMVLPIFDHKYDEVWSAQLDSLLRKVFPIGEIVLYGSRDSFVSAYTGKFRTEEVETQEHADGTTMRKLVGRKPIDSSEFRSGVIYLSQNQYDRVFMTVDIACFKGDEILLGSKKGEHELRFPGGFVDIKDKTLQEAAVRELAEESGNEAADWHIIYDCKVMDWRVQKCDAIHTVLFKCTYLHGPSMGNDDLVKVGWYPIKDLPNLHIVGEHRKMLEALQFFKQEHGDKK